MVKPLGLSRKPMAPGLFDNLEKISRCFGPVFIAHGDSDHLIPLSQADRLFAAAREPKQFLVLNSCGHHGGLSLQFLTSLAAFLKDVEGRRATPHAP
jgi:fermentation-respiration switch protein FrsA (DUF1100 family)